MDIKLLPDLPASSASAQLNQLKTSKITTCKQFARYYQLTSTRKMPTASRTATTAPSRRSHHSLESGMPSAQCSCIQLQSVLQSPQNGLHNASMTSEKDTPNVTQCLQCASQPWNRVRRFQLGSKHFQSNPIAFSLQQKSALTSSQSNLTAANFGSTENAAKLPSVVHPDHSVRESPAQKASSGSSLISLQRIYWTNRLDKYAYVNSSHRLKPPPLLSMKAVSTIKISEMLQNEGFLNRNDTLTRKRPTKNRLASGGSARDDSQLNLNSDCQALDWSVCEQKQRHFGSSPVDLLELSMERRNTTTAQQKAKRTTRKNSRKKRQSSVNNNTNLASITTSFERKSDVRYKETGGGKLQLDIYLPQYSEIC